MFFPGVVKVKRNEVCLSSREGELVKVLKRGRHLVNVWNEDYDHEVISMQNPVLKSTNIEDFFTSPLLDGIAEKVEVKEEEMGLLWIDDKFSQFLDEGKHILFNTVKKIHVEVVSTKESLFEHSEIRKIRTSVDSLKAFNHLIVGRDEVIVWYHEDEFKKVLEEGTHVFWKDSGKNEFHTINLRQRFFEVKDFDEVNNKIFEAEYLEKELSRIEVADGERILLWINGSFEAILDSGRYLLFNRFFKVKTERITISSDLFKHKAIKEIWKSRTALEQLNLYDVEAGCVGVWYHDGEFQEVLTPGNYSFWKESGKNRVHIIDKREKVLDIQGQDILTADRVTVRLNVAVALQVVDARKQVEMVEDAQQMIYREIQLALREMVGQQKLDEMLVSKETLAADIFAKVVDRCTHFGVKINRVGVRDVILPGEMKELLNRVVEAQKSAEANLISRREETAAMRSQMNTAKMIENNPTLMRLKEMEVLERIAEKSQLQILVGEKSMTEQVMKLV